MVAAPPWRVTSISRVGKRSGWCLVDWGGWNHFSNWLHCPFGVSRSVRLERAVNSPAALPQQLNNQWKEKVWLIVDFCRSSIRFYLRQNTWGRKRLRWACFDKHNRVTALSYDVLELCTNLLLCVDDGSVIPSLPSSSSDPPPPTQHKPATIFILLKTVPDTKLCLIRDHLFLEHQYWPST